MKPEKNKDAHNLKKSKNKNKSVLENSKHDLENTNQTNKRSKKRKNEKLFKEEQFEDVDTIDEVSLPKKKRSNKDAHKGNDNGTSGKKASLLKKKKGKGKNNLTNSVFEDSTEKNVKGLFSLKKSKKSKHLALVEDAATEEIPDSQVHNETKKKKKKIIQTKTSENLNEKNLSAGATTSKQKKKKRKVKREKLLTAKGNELENDNVDLDKPRVQRTSPNAAKFLFINIIKNTLRKKISMSKNKLKKKVIEKFCKAMGIEEKPEFSKEYERSLMLTYGIEILEDTVKLKQ